MARHGGNRAGRWPVQLRFKTDLTSEDYVNQEAWRFATLECCPLHPDGGCSVARHGTYERVDPPGTQIPRWYCPEGQCTFSLLADCFASRLSGSLHEIEEVVIKVEQAKTIQAATDRLRLDIELPGAIRWTRRRTKYVHASLTTIRGLFPERFAGCQGTVTSFRKQLDRNNVLLALREIAAMHLASLAAPLGFRPLPIHRGEHKMSCQHQTGADPPPPIQ